MQTRSRWRSLVMPAIGCLVVGAVAFAAVLVVVLRSEPRPGEMIIMRAWPSPVPGSFPPWKADDTHSINAESWLAFGREAVCAGVYANEDNKSFSCWSERVGWPLEALQLDRFWETTYPSATGSRALRPSYIVLDDKMPETAGIAAPEFLSARTAMNTSRIPTVIVWRGFLCDLAFFWFAAAVCFVSVRWIYRTALHAARRRRGVCELCIYDRRGLAADAKCPECGTVPAPAAK